MKKHQQEIFEAFKKAAQDLLLSFRSEEMVLSFHSEEAAQVINDAVEGLHKQRKAFLLSQVAQVLLIKEELKWDFLLAKGCDPLAGGMILRSKGGEEGNDWICDYDIIDLDDEITMLCNGGLIESNPSEGIKALIEYAPSLEGIPVVEASQMYLVMLLCKEAEIEASNLPFLTSKLNLAWKEGQIGAIPVFAEYADALAAADGRAELVKEIVFGDGDRLSN